jgi:hypothetical protein
MSTNPTTSMLERLITQSVPEQIQRIAVVLHEWGVDDEDVLHVARLVLSAVLLPLEQQSPDIRKHFPGTEEFRLWRTPANKQSPEETAKCAAWGWR